MKIKAVILLLLLIALPTSTYAVYEVLDSRCTTDIKITLRSKASSFAYSINKIDNNGTITYDLELLNIDNLIYVVDSIDNKIYKSDDVISDIKPGTIVKLGIYASDSTYCSGYKINTITVQIPYYNSHYTNELCKGYEYYYLCKENSNINMTDKEFESSIKEYIDSLKQTNNEENNNNVNENNNFDIVSFIVKYNIYISGFGILLLIGYIMYMIRRMNKKRGIL